MHDFKRQHFYWANIANGVYTTAARCSSCIGIAVNREMKTMLHLFTSALSLSSFTLDVLCLIPETDGENATSSYQLYLYYYVTKATLTKDESDKGRQNVYVTSRRQL